MISKKDKENWDRHFPKNNQRNTQKTMKKPSSHCEFMVFRSIKNIIKYSGLIEK
jgi:hypothetical protein